jgi:hypothetical protein
VQLEARLQLSYYQENVRQQQLTLPLHLSSQERLAVHQLTVPPPFLSSPTQETEMQIHLLTRTQND